MSEHDKRYQRRKSSSDAMKQQREAHMNKDKEQRRKSTVAKLWNWLGTKKEEEETQKKPEAEKKPAKPKRAAKKSQRAHTVAVVDGHRHTEEDWSDASSDGEVLPAPPPLRRHQHAHTAALTPPHTPDHRPVGSIPEEEEISPSHAKALEASRGQHDYDDTSTIEQKLTNMEPSSHKNHSKSKAKGSSGGARPKQPQASSKSSGSAKGGKKRRKKRTAVMTAEVDTSVPLEWPATPETILNYHKRKPFLTPNEEWLIMELHEFECLLESMDMVHKIAKFSKFFELDPPELLEEFFEFAEEIPSYDEVINTDIWQEFRDVRYPY